MVGYVIGTHDRGNRHKFATMFERAGATTVPSVRGCDGYIVQGDTATDYLRANRYALDCADIASLRWNRPYRGEREMVEGARAILCTSEYHARYLSTTYTCVTPEVVHLRPLASDLDFAPLPKKPKTIVYAGGITASLPTTYRSYADVFPALIDAGWEVHLYPAYSRQAQGFYERQGAIWHDPVPQSELYRELSQYAIGFHGYSESADTRYIQTILPNKCWDYLAAGIPTLGVNAGPGGAIYDKKWGVAVPTMAEAIEALEDVARMDVSRFTETIDGDLPTFERVLSCV